MNYVVDIPKNMLISLQRSSAFKIDSLIEFYGGHFRTIIKRNTNITKKFKSIVCTFLLIGSLFVTYSKIFEINTICHII